MPAADHSLKVPKRRPLTQDEALAVVLEATLEWVVREVVRESKRVSACSTTRDADDQTTEEGTVLARSTGLRLRSPR